MPQIVASVKSSLSVLIYLHILGKARSGFVGSIAAICRMTANLEIIPVQKSDWGKRPNRDFREARFRS
jgi:hypothetical protein